MAGRAPCSIDSLPDAVLGRILALVDAAITERGTLLLVCKRWQRAYLAEPAAWESLSTNLVVPESAAQMAGLLQQAQCTGRHVRSADILLHQADEGPLPWLLQLLRCLHPARLRVLRVCGSPLSATAATELCRFAEQLQDLSVHSDPLPPNAPAMTAQLTALQRLWLSGDSGFSPSLVAAISCLPQLLQLRLASGAPLPDPAPLTALASLLELELHESASTEEGLRLPAVSGFASLERLAALAPVMQMPDGHLCRFTQWPEPETSYVRWKRETGADGTAEASVRVRHAVLDAWDEDEGAGESPLPSMLRAALLPGVPLRTLAVAESCIYDRTFDNCGPLLTAVSRLVVYGNAVRVNSTDEALQTALQALVSLVPGVRHLELSSMPAERMYAVGWSLFCGLPPAVTALRHLEALAVTEAKLPSLPEGPYLTGLTFLTLRSNSLAGPLPPSLSTATALRTLHLQHNPELYLTPACVAALAALPALTSVCLEHTGASPARAAQLARRLPQLHFIEGLYATGWSGRELPGMI